MGMIGLWGANRDVEIGRGGVYDTIDEDNDDTDVSMTMSGEEKRELRPMRNEKSVMIIQMICTWR